ncbi:50S ribosomal protein L7/L12 [Patescibacteria group bacterium]
MTEEKKKEAETVKKAPKAESEKADKEVVTSPKLSKIIEQVENLSVLELNDLVKALEDKFGVSAMPTAIAAPAAGGAGSGTDQAEEKTEFNVVLAETGSQKIQVIKTLREIDQNLGLKEAKDLADAAPKEILTGVKKEKAEEAKTKLEAAGAKVELK